MEAANRDRLLLRYPSVALALEEIDPNLVAEALSSVVRKREELGGLTEEELRNAMGSLGSTGLFWDALPESSWPRMRACAENSDLSQLVEAGAFSLSAPSHQAAKSVAEVLDDRVAELNAQELAQSMERKPSQRLIDAAVRRVVAGLSWSNTNALLPALLSNVSLLTRANVEDLLGAAVSAYDVFTARVSDSELRKLFLATPDRAELRDRWLEAAAVRRDDTGPPSFAYPLLRISIADEWGPLET